MAYKFLLMSELVALSGKEKGSVEKDIKSKRLPAVKSGMYFLIEERKLKKYLNKKRLPI